MRDADAYKVLHSDFRPIARIEVIELDSGCDDGQTQAGPYARLWEDEEPDECQLQRPADEVTYATEGSCVHSSKLTL